MRPGADYNWSLKLLERFKEAHPEIPTKSGLMVGLGETNEEIIEVMRDLRRHGVTMLTLGQYLQPSRHHLPVQRYVSPEEFEEMKAEAMAMGFYPCCLRPVRPLFLSCRSAGKRYGSKNNSCLSLAVVRGGLIYRLIPLSIVIPGCIFFSYPKR